MVCINGRVKNTIIIGEGEREPFPDVLPLFAYKLTCHVFDRGRSSLISLYLFVLCVPFEDK